MKVVISQIMVKMAAKDGPKNAKRTKRKKTNLKENTKKARRRENFERIENGMTQASLSRLQQLKLKVLAKKRLKKLI